MEALGYPGKLPGNIILQHIRDRKIELYISYPEISYVPCGYHPAHLLHDELIYLYDGSVALRYGYEDVGRYESVSVMKPDQCLRGYELLLL